MQVLNTRQRTFVILLWESQPISATQAYIQAGYTSNRESAVVNASRLLQDDRIKKAIVEYGRAYSAAFAPELHGILMAMARNPQEKDRAKVALAMFKHSGFVEVIEQNMNVNVTVTRQEKIDFLRTAMLEEGKTPAEIDALLGTPAEHEITDAVYEEVPELEDEEY